MIFTVVEIKSGGYQQRMGGLTVQSRLHPEDIARILEWADCVLFLNRNTGDYIAGGVSHGLIEAMLAGRIIIAWDNETHSQCIDNTSGYLIEENNMTKLKKTLLKLSNSGIDISKCANARTKAVTHFSVASHVKAFLSAISCNHKDN